MDVRDVAEFALDQVESDNYQVHNLASPLGRDSMGGLLQACLEVTGGVGDLEWVRDEVLLSAGVQQWTELPLWWAAPGVSDIDPGSADKAGFRSRPLAETIADIWSWLTDGNTPVPHRRWAKHGIDPVKERQILEGPR
ncbi:hypothetical protein [Kitasatospora sp. NPDC004289]